MKLQLLLFLMIVITGAALAVALKSDHYIGRDSNTAQAIDLVALENRIIRDKIDVLDLFTILKDVITEGDGEKIRTLAYFLADIYDLKNTELNIRFQTLSALKGNRDSQYWLGYANLEGLAGREKGLVEQASSAEAFKWFTRAAEQGHSESQIYLANMYFRSDYGVGVDFIEAYKWYTLGNANNHPKWKQLFYDLERSMSADQIDLAKQKAKNWKASFKVVSAPTVDVKKFIENNRKVSLPILSPEVCQNALNDNDFRKTEKGLNVVGILCGKSSSYYCKPKEQCGSLVGIDCNSAGDGTYYFVDINTKKVIETCSFWSGPCKKPKKWNCENIKHYKG